MSKKVKKKQSADPRAAVRGSAVRRAKAALGDALDQRLNLAGYRPEQVAKDEAARLALLCRASKHHDAAERLPMATLGELEDWAIAVERLTLNKVRRAVGLPERGKVTR